MQTIGKTHTGIEAEPVEVANAAHRDEILGALMRTFERGHPHLSIFPPDICLRPWVVLKYANVKSRATFIKGMTGWRLEKDETGSYCIRPQIKAPKERSVTGWMTDESKMEVFSVSTPMDKIAERMADLILKANK